MVECQPSKLNVGSSNLLTRFREVIAATQPGSSQDPVAGSPPRSADRNRTEFKTTEEKRIMIENRPVRRSRLMMGSFALAGSLSILAATLGAGDANTPPSKELAIARMLEIGKSIGELRVCGRIRTSLGSANCVRRDKLVRFALRGRDCCANTTRSARNLAAMIPQAWALPQATTPLRTPAKARSRQRQRLPPDAPRPRLLSATSTPSRSRTTQFKARL